MLLHNELNSIFLTAVCLCGEEWILCGWDRGWRGGGEKGRVGGGGGGV